jgi:hypothetical protein
MGDRKYRHRGYQDGGSFEGRSEPRTRAPQPRRERPEGPRGRGLGAPTETVFKCRACGAKVPLLEELAFDAACRVCGADLHACANCLHFDSAAPNECRKGVPERISNKVRRNECALFAPRTVQEFGSEAESVRANDPRAAFNALFKK